MTRDPIGFAVSCTDKKGPKPFEIKLYSIVDFGKFVRFRLVKKLGNFPSFEEGSKRAEEYARINNFPYAWKIRHNSVVPKLVYKWYFKNAPTKFLESLHR